MQISTYEEKIMNILQKEGIQFEREKTFSDLKQGKFRFDFYISQNKIAIECDGPQHFKRVPFFQKNRRDFLKTKEHDRKKNAYCLAHNILLFRLPYFDFDSINSIEDILVKKYLVISIYHNDFIKV